MVAETPRPLRPERRSSRIGVPSEFQDAAARFCAGRLPFGLPSLLEQSSFGFSFAVMAQFLPVQK